MTIGDALRIALRHLMALTPLRRYFFHRYEYGFNPAQLTSIHSMCRKALRSEGDLVEIGCYVGATTVFLCKEVMTLVPARRYYAIDTFKSFVPEHIDHEITKRGKAASIFGSRTFSVNSKEWFSYTMRLNGIDIVTPVEDDICTVDLERLGARFCFALIDTDLYLPVRHSLEKVYPLMNPGGIMVVDDCMPNSDFDGAYQAYVEFCESRGLPIDIRESKLGVVKVPGGGSSPDRPAIEAGEASS